MFKGKRRCEDPPLFVLSVGIALRVGLAVSCVYDVYSLLTCFQVFKVIIVLLGCFYANGAQLPMSSFCTELKMVNRQSKLASRIG